MNFLKPTHGLVLTELLEHPHSRKRLPGVILSFDESTDMVPPRTRRGRPLRERELQFLRLACSEMTYKEIAAHMCLSPRTVDGYRDALFDKLGIRTRVGLVMYAIREGIVRL